MSMQAWKGWIYEDRYVMMMMLKKRILKQLLKQAMTSQNILLCFSGGCVCFL